MKRVGSTCGHEVGDRASSPSILCRSGVCDDGHTAVHARDIRLETLPRDGNVIDLLAVEEKVVGAGTCSVCREDLALRAGASARLRDDLNAGQRRGQLDRIQ